MSVDNPFNDEISNYIEMIEKVPQEPQGIPDDIICTVSTNNTNTDSDIDDDRVQPKNINKNGKGSKRFIWSFSLEQQKFFKNVGKNLLYNPFLTDMNVEDLLFSEQLMSKKPHRAGPKQKKKVWTDFALELQLLKDPNGSLLFDKISNYSARSRAENYLKMAEYWLQKNGAINAQGSFVNEEEIEAKEYNKMNTWEKIYHNVIEYIVDCEEFSNEIRQKKDSKDQQEKDDNEKAEWMQRRAVGLELFNDPKFETATSASKESSSESNETGMQIKKIHCYKMK
ncbi:MAG: hypothetical protein SFU27_03800 [Thermonemataceae bacterium]|nr:hypothetical protein [Thermonemataceae bacterium]